MKGKQMHVGQSLGGVQQFLDAHADVLASVNESDARKQLDAVVTRLGPAAAEQNVHYRELRGMKGNRLQLESVLVRKYMTPLAKWARANLQGSPSLAALTPSAGSLNRQPLVTAAEGMVKAANPYADRLTRGSFPAGFLDQFQVAITGLAEALFSRKGKSTAHSGATKSIVALLKEGRTAVVALDGLVSHQILGDARLEREWAVAKRIRRAHLTVAATPPAPPALVAPTTQEVQKAA